VNEGSIHLADWPRPTGVQFLLASAQTVAHGDDSTSSIIGGERSAVEINTHRRFGNISPKSVLNRLALYLFVDYVRNRRLFKGIRGYVGTVLRHRVVWHAGRILGHRSGLAPQIYVLSLRRRRRS
jgi:hypothetical protein